MAIFNPDGLSDPRVHCYLTNFFDPLTHEIRVERTVGRTWLKVDGAEAMGGRFGKYGGTKRKA